MKPIHAMAVFCTVFLLFSTVVTAQQPAATVTVPNLIKFTGTLKDPNGLPRVGSIEIKFGLYASQEGGDALWNETQLVQTDTEGNYSVYLGASEQTGLPVDLFSSQKARWLGVQIQNEAEQSRVLLVAVPYALKAADADTVGGKPISSFVLYEDLATAVQMGSPSTVVGAPGVGRAVAAPGAGATGSSSGGTGINGSLGSSKGTVRPLGNEGDSQHNTYYGTGAGAALTTGWGNAFLGYLAGNLNTTGNANSFIGHQTGTSNTTGNSNSFVGFQTGLFNTTGNYNTLVGGGAGYSNITGDSNSFVGSDAGFSNTTGGSNSFVGNQAGYGNTTGIANSFFGENAGWYNTIENYNTFIGASSTGAAGITNATAIGNRAQVTQSNSLVLGGVNGANGATAETFVGIGVTAPDRQLTVEGSQALGRFRRYATANYSPAFLFERSRGTQAAASDIAAGDVLGKVQFRGRVGGLYPEYGALQFIATDTSQNGRYAFFDHDLVTERVSILNTGKVGIGTTNPTEALQVVGNIKVSGSILYGAPADEVPDYVFEPGYKLMSVEELQKFLAAEKHLPNVPSAAEIKEKGLNLSEFQMRLLEKIEELTLYIVDKDAEIASLKADFDARLAVLEQHLKKQERK